MAVEGGVDEAVEVALRLGLAVDGTVELAVAFVGFAAFLPVAVPVEVRVMSDSAVPFLRGRAFVEGSGLVCTAGNAGFA